MNKDRIIEYIKGTIIIAFVVLCTIVFIFLLAQAERNSKPFITREGIITEISADNIIIVEDEAGGMWTLNLEDYEMLPGQRILITVDKESYSLARDKHDAITKIRLTLYDK